MMMNILGATLICVSTGILGVYYGNKSQRQIHTLSGIKKSFLLLKHEIEHAMNPLYIAFENIAHKMDGEIQSFYKELAEKLSNNQDLADCFKEIQELKNIPKDIIKEITTLGRYLSSIDKTIQLNAINMANTHIDIILEGLFKTSTKDKKLYRGLGVLLGLLIVIVLV